MNLSAATFHKKKTIRIHIKIRLVIYQKGERQLKKKSCFNKHF